MLFLIRCPKRWRTSHRRDAMDSLIAAHALSVGLGLVTKNEADFRHYPSRVVENRACRLNASAQHTFHSHSGPENKNGTRRRRFPFLRAELAASAYWTSAGSYLIHSNSHHQTQAVPAFTFNRHACSSGSV